MGGGGNGRLCDPDFSDDITLTEDKPDCMQNLTKSVSDTCQTNQIAVDVEKTEVMSINKQSLDPITSDQNVTRFTYTSEVLYQVMGALSNKNR